MRLTLGLTTCISDWPEFLIIEHDFLNHRFFPSISSCFSYVCTMHGRLTLGLTTCISHWPEFLIIEHDFLNHRFFPSISSCFSYVCTMHGSLPAAVLPSSSKCTRLCFRSILSCFASLFGTLLKLQVAVFSLLLSSNLSSTAFTSLSSMSSMGSRRRSNMLFNFTGFFATA